MKYLTVLLLFISNLSFSASPAIDSIIEASKIHFGVDKALKNTSIYIQNRLKIEKPVKITLGIWTIWKTKTINFKISKNSIQLSPNSVTISRNF